jgi:hypothetical protein
VPSSSGAASPRRRGSSSFLDGLIRGVAKLAPFFAALFALGALRHGIALGWPRAGDASPPWRHLLFVGINAIFSIAFARRLRWLPIPCAILTAQQLHSHGTDLVESVRAGAWDLSSLGVVLVFPFILLSAAGIARGKAS